MLLHILIAQLESFPKNIKLVFIKYFPNYEHWNNFLILQKL